MQDQDCPKGKEAESVIEELATTKEGALGHIWIKTYKRTGRAKSWKDRNSARRNISSETAAGITKFDIKLSNLPKLFTEKRVEW